MKKLAMMAAIILSISACNSQKKEFSKEALSYELTATDQNKVSFQSILDQHKGKKVVVEIWAGWCSDCVKAMPLVKDMQAKNPTVDYVFISMDKTFDAWQTAVAKHELKGSLYWVNDEKMMKGTFGKAIDLDWIPRYIVIDEKGKIEIYRAIEKDFDLINKVLAQ
jgi:thiol-disulfide isomerase/thioredoxin